MKLLTLAEAAEMLGISTRTLQRMMQRREIPHVRLGYAIRFNLKDLERWVEEHTVPAI